MRQSKTRNYYNEFNPRMAAWLRQHIADGIIPPGDVDERSIHEVKAHEVKGYTQCHFFAGIGGWSIALRIAGWPEDRPVWTGSCPCQSFSRLGNKAGTSDPRHLWPVFASLIAQSNPVKVYGEQVATAIEHGWLDGVYTDMEAEDYAVSAAVLGAHSVKAPQKRQRLYWVADRSVHESSKAYQLGPNPVPVVLPAATDAWSSYDSFSCGDGCERRIGPGLRGLAHGVSFNNHKFHGYGNAIVPQVAAAWIIATTPGLGERQ